MANENLLPVFTDWTINESPAGTLTGSFAASSDGASCTFSVSDEGAYIYKNIATDAIKGHDLKLTITSFTVSDNLGWIQIRLYDAAASEYTSVDKYSADITFPYELTVSIPADCGRVRVVLRHQYDSDGISPAAEFAISGVTLIDTYSESLTTINYHKILEENLPASVTPGSEHVYYTSDGTLAKMFITTKAGAIMQVGGTTSGEASVTAEYANTFTQAWIDERKQELIALTKLGHCIVFAVATDIHVRIEDGDAGRYNQIRDFIMLSKQLPLDYVICEGDIMSYCQDWDETFEPRIEKTKEIFDLLRCPWWAVRGNHDYNSDDYNPNSANANIKTFDATTADKYLITNEIWYRSMLAQMPQPCGVYVVFDDARRKYGYYYVDDYFNKHRMIFLNSEETHETSLGRPYITTGGVADCFVSGIETEHQLNWLINSAMNMTGKTDWTVTFHSHTVPYTDAAETDKSEFHGYGGDNPTLRQIVAAFQTGGSVSGLKYSALDVDTHEWKELTISKDFSAQGAIPVAGWFGGHCHDDCYRKVSGLNVCISTCTCPEYRTSWSADATPTKLPPERNTSTLAMSANVFIINTDTRAVNMLKFGSKRDNAVKTSSDLSFTY